MFTMFNLDKKQKLEDVKIVSIASEGVVDATKNIFLLENNNFDKDNKKKLTKVPSFLNKFIKNEVNGKFKKDKSVVFMQLFPKEVINDVKYYIFNIKISNSDEKKIIKKNNNDKSDVKRSSYVLKQNETEFSSFDEKDPLKDEENNNNELKVNKSKNESKKQFNKLNNIG